MYDKMGMSQGGGQGISGSYGMMRCTPGSGLDMALKLILMLGLGWYAHGFFVGPPYHLHGVDRIDCSLASKIWEGTIFWTG